MEELGFNNQEVIKAGFLVRIKVPENHNDEKEGSNLFL
jgi:hypothetical protein